MIRSLLALLAASAALVQAAGAVQSAAAIFASQLSVRSIKQSEIHRPNPNLNGTCIASLNDTALAAEFETLLQDEFSSSEVGELNVFLSSSAAEKYLEETLRLIRERSFGISEEPASFSDDEWGQLETFTNSKVGERYHNLIQSSTDKVRPSVIRMLTSCKRK